MSKAHGDFELKGEYRDILFGPGGDCLFETPWRSNLIVNGLRSLLAALVKGDSQGMPLAFWAVGVGQSAWDGGTVPTDAVRRTLTGLYAETGRKTLSPTQITFIGGTLTNLLQVQATFTTADIVGSPAVASLREFGLFAGGASVANSGVLINHRIHPRIDLQAGLTLERTLRLTF